MPKPPRITVLSTEHCLANHGYDLLVESFNEAGFPTDELIMRCGVARCKMLELFYINPETSNVNIKTIGSTCLLLDGQQT